MSIAPVSSERAHYIGALCASRGARAWAAWAIPAEFHAQFHAELHAEFHAQFHGGGVGVLGLAVAIGVGSAAAEA